MDYSNKKNTGADPIVEIFAAALELEAFYAGHRMPESEAAKHERLRVARADFIAALAAGEDV